MSAVAERVGALPSPAASLRVPAQLAVRSLSVSSIRRWVKCREDWRRHYLLDEPEVVRAPMLAGRAYGAAVQAFYWARINGSSLSGADADDLLLSEYGAEVAGARADRTLAAGEDPAAALEGARAPLRGYLRDVAPRVAEPRAIERELRAEFPGAQWGFVAYLDVDTATAVIDGKLSGSNKWKQATADRDWQATGYLLSRRLVGEPAERFEFHIARPGREEIEVLETGRSPEQLAHFEGLIALVARQIAHACETGDFGYAPEGAWWCAARWCAHYQRCPAGGALSENASTHNNQKEEA